MQDNSPIYIERLAPQRPTYKVAVVTETYPPDINGVAHTLSKIVQGLQANGHLIWLIRPRQQAAQVANSDERLEEVLVKGMPIPFYKQLRMGLPAKRHLTRLWTLQRPDLVPDVLGRHAGAEGVQVVRSIGVRVRRVEEGRGRHAVDIDDLRRGRAVVRRARVRARVEEVAALAHARLDA